MNKIQLKIPIELTNLIDKGIWPKNLEESMRQNLQMIISKKCLNRIAPDEDSIYFYPPPFKDIRSLSEKNIKFWREYGALDTINSVMCLMIGDFGIGSDAALILDFSEDISSPKVKRQIWGEQRNYWDTVASNFNEFLLKIELIQDSI